MDRKAVLAAIEQCVCHDQLDAYGDKFARSAAIANIVLESKLMFALTPLDVALFLACVKLGTLEKEAPVGVEDR